MHLCLHILVESIPYKIFLGENMDLVYVDLYLMLAYDEAEIVSPHGMFLYLISIMRINFLLFDTFY